MGFAIVIDPFSAYNRPIRLLFSLLSFLCIFVARFFTLPAWACLGVLESFSHYLIRPWFSLEKPAFIVIQLCSFLLHFSLFLPAQQTIVSLAQQQGSLNSLEKSILVIDGELLHLLSGFISNYHSKHPNYSFSIVQQKGSLNGLEKSFLIIDGKL